MTTDDTADQRAQFQRAVSDGLIMWAMAHDAWSKGGGNCGTLTCCRCGGAFMWLRVPSNGHLHGRCETPDCTGFMQ